jgi:hypothetical protein
LPGFISFSGVIKRWERLQAHALEKDMLQQQSKQEWMQFKLDLQHLLAWLDEAEAFQRGQQDIGTDIKDLEVDIKRHKVRYLEH